MPSAPIIIGTIGLLGYGLYSLFGGGKKKKEDCPSGHFWDVSTGQCIEDLNPDPPPPPPPPPPGGDPYAALCMNSVVAAEGWTVLMIQQTLTQVGYPVSADGSCGKKTKDAIGSFQKNHALSVTRYVNESTSHALITALDAVNAKTDGTVEEKEYANGCEDGRTWAKKSIAASKDVSPDISAYSKSYKLGFRTCFLKKLNDGGYEYNEDGNIYTSTIDDWTYDGGGAGASDAADILTKNLF